MKKVIIVVVILIILIGGYFIFRNNGSKSSYSTSNTSATNSSGKAPLSASQTTNSDSASVLNVSSDPALGSFLTAENGMTLYKFSADSKGASKCTGQCAINWPPYAVSAGASLTKGASLSGAISTLKRSDGTMQVTYNGAPLYFFFKDTKSGETNGQNINAFGGIWTVVSP